MQVVQDGHGMGRLYPAVVMEEEEEKVEPPDEDSGVMKMICHYSVCVS